MVREVPTVPMFPEPEPVEIELSRMWSGPRFRATEGTVKYTPIKVKVPVDCTECFARQHETGGDSGPRRTAKVRRAIVKAPGSAIDLCREHEMLWRARDDHDESATRRR
jgi:hypothetical protein